MKEHKKWSYAHHNTQWNHGCNESHDYSEEEVDRYSVEIIFITNVSFEKKIITFNNYIMKENTVLKIMFKSKNMKTSN